MQFKACCKGNNYEQRFALDTFPADLSWRNVLAKPCILLFTLQQDCNTREACRLLRVVKVVFVVFPNSAGVVSPRSVVSSCLSRSKIVTRVACKVPFHGTLSRHGKARASSVLRMAYRKRCLLVVKVVFVVFPNSAGILSLVVKAVFVVFPNSAKWHFRPHKPFFCSKSRMNQKKIRENVGARHEEGEPVLYVVLYIDLCHFQGIFVYYPFYITHHALLFFFSFLFVLAFLFATCSLFFLFSCSVFPFFAYSCVFFIDGIIVYKSYLYFVRQLDLLSSFISLSIRPLQTRLGSFCHF